MGVVLLMYHALGLVAEFRIGTIYLFMGCGSISGDVDKGFSTPPYIVQTVGV